MSEELSFTCSEDLVKALRGPPLSASEKLNLAEKLCSGKGYLPHREVFLSEWIVTSLVKSTGKETDLGFGRVPHLSEGYWSLFLKTLDYVSGNKKNFRDLESLSSNVFPHHKIDSDDVYLRKIRNITNYLKKTPITAAFSAVMEFAEISILHAIKSIEDYDLHSALISVNHASVLIQAVIPCFHKLDTTLYQPTLDQLAALVLNTCKIYPALFRILSLICDEAQGDFEQKEIEENHSCLSKKLITLKELFLKLASSIVSSFKKFLISSPNSKKVYTIVFGKLFYPLLEAYYFSEDFKTKNFVLNRENDNQSETIVNNIGHIKEILQIGLFQQEHIMEYGFNEPQNISGSSESPEKVPAGYQNQFFNKISEMLKSPSSGLGTVLHQRIVIQGFPLLFRFFIEEIRKKNLSNETWAHKKHLSSEKERLFEFNFFEELYVFLEQAIDSAISEKSKITLLLTSMSTLTQMLSQLLHYNLYVPSNDQISSRQNKVLYKVTGLLVELAKMSSQVQEIQRYFLTAITFLLQIDYRVVDHYLPQLWEYLLMPFTEVEAECISLLTVLLETYAKSQEMKRFLTTMVNGFKIMQSKNDNVLRKPLFRRDFLQQFSKMVQAQDLIEIFTKELLDPVDSICIHTQNVDAETLPQKRPRSSKNDNLNIIFDDNPNFQVIPLPSSSLIIITFVHFLKALKITPPYAENIERSLKNLFERFISPIISRTFDNLDITFFEDHLYPALLLHSHLLDISFYSHNFSGLSLANELVKMLSLIDHPKIKLLTNKIILKHVCRNHHTFYSISEDTAIVKENRELQIQGFIYSVVNTLNLPKNNNFCSWTGRFLDLTSENFDLANLKLASEWLDLICNYSKENELEKIARLIVKAFISIPSKSQFVGEISYESVCFEIFRSAEFFELYALRGVFLKIYFEELFRFLEDQLKYFGLDSDFASRLLNYLKTILLFQNQTSSIDFWESILPLFLVQPISHNKRTFPLFQTTLFFKMALLFPSEYFKKEEKDSLITVAFLVEKLISSLFHVQDRNDMISLLDFSFTCRNLTAQLIKLGNRESCMRHHQAFLAWWLTSIHTYHLRSNELRSKKNEIDKVFSKAIEDLVRVSGQVLSMSVEHFLLRAHDRSATPGQEYWEGVVTFFKSLPTYISSPVRFSQWINSVTRDELEYDIQMSFLCDFMDACVSHFLKKNRYERNPIDELNMNEEKIWCSFTKLCDSIEKDLGMALGTFFDFALKKLDDKEDQVLVMSKFSRLKNLVRIYGILMRYHPFVQASPPESPSKPLFMFLPSFFALPIPLLRLVSSVAEDSETFQSCTTILSIALEASPFFDPPLSNGTILKIFALLWVSLKIIHEKDSSGVYSTQLLSCFGNFIKKLSKEQYSTILDGFYTRLDPSNIRTKLNEEIEVTLNLIEVVIRDSNQDQRQELRKFATRILTQLCTIGPKMESIKHRIKIFDFLTSIVTNQIFIENFIPLILSTTITLIFNSKNLEYQSAKGIFEVTCHLLHTILIHRRNQLVDSLPSFIAILQELFHFFKSSSYLPRSRKQLQTYTLSFTCLELTGSPLDNEALLLPCAEIMSSLLKAVSPKNSTMHRSAKVFGSYVPILLREYMEIQTDEQIGVQVKDALRSGIYSLMDLCGERERDQVMVTLDKAGKVIFQNLWAQYLKEWMYTGGA
ncbi:hypothetical protein G9A89_016703 [Geosiphon pyriformis]|nr:hypothetical protein G9A89_016703 [Geosiphon pyriformis]